MKPLFDMLCSLWFIAIVIFALMKSVNVLFGANIELNFENWFAMLVIYLAIKINPLFADKSKL